jgi:CO dehydrogenase/acetyl-CoA synthase gamma subunit (corrinoid Fe-S protein)
VASADLYLDTINILRYLNRADCVQCGFTSCAEFIDALRSGLKKPQDCSFISANQAYALDVIQRIKDLWPAVPLLTHPRPSLVGLVELNRPDASSSVIITGNNEYTEQVLMTVLSTTVCPFFILFIDTDGNTVDMAMIYKTLTAERIHKAVIETDIVQKASRKELIVPGLASPLKNDIENDRLECEGRAGLCGRTTSFPFRYLDPSGGIKSVVPSSFFLIEAYMPATFLIKEFLSKNGFVRFRVSPPS